MIITMDRLLELSFIWNSVEHGESRPLLQVQ